MVKEKYTFKYNKIITNDCYQSEFFKTKIGNMIIDLSLSPYNSTMLSDRVGYEVHLKERPLGIASENNFELVRVRVPDLKRGQILVRNVWMSVDPYMRGRMSETKSYLPPFELNKPLEGDCIGQIIESKNPQFKVGEYLLSNFGWREYWVSTGSNDISKIVPTLAPLQSYLGIMGRTGLTAYVGLLIGELTDSSTSNTVFVSAASGA